MTKEIAVSVTSLSKTYKLFKSKQDFLKEAIHFGRKAYHKKFHALKDIDLQINKGEVIGIIGKNGSGKSTLLKILASIVTPTTGQYSCKGKVAALLELSGGFDLELTGVKNINFLGELQGFSKKEMKARTAMILDFAEIGEYAWQPVKSYSSGMYMRLAFSFSIHVDPEVLIVDEILGVGDLKFQKKCFSKMQKFKDRGMTIILCSHDLEVVKNFCSRAIWIHQGEIKESGSPTEVVSQYNAFMTENLPVNK